jgi:hypothetical protein
MRSDALLALFALLALPRSAPCGEATWRALVVRELAQHPAMEIPDLYKLLLQATMGSEHAAADSAMAREWMHRELATLGPAVPGEPLLDTLGRDGRYARVNLRPFIARGGDPERLLDAFLETPVVAPPDTTAFRCAEVAAESLAVRGAARWPIDSLRDYFARERGAGFPAVDHSAGYVERYHPAYRVVARRLLRRVLPGG